MNWQDRPNMSERKNNLLNYNEKNLR